MINRNGVLTAGSWGMLSAFRLAVTMQTLKLLVTFFIALWLHHIATTAALLKNLTIDYREVHKVKNLVLPKENDEQNIFTHRTLPLADVEPTDFVLREEKHTKHFTVMKQEWKSLEKEHVIPCFTRRFSQNMVFCLMITDTSYQV